jgi:hypothetical protein
MHARPDMDTAPLIPKARLRRFGFKGGLILDKGIQDSRHEARGVRSLWLIHLVENTGFKEVACRLMCTSCVGIMMMSLA